MRSDPVILVGMHRSGTSATMAALRACGLYAGRRTGGHSESRFFRRLNVELLTSEGAAWSDPAPFLESLNDPARREALEGTLARRIDADLRRQFLTFSRRWRLRLGSSFPWGWKDPRTCLTLPLWLERYPEARVIHLLRHPLDVALSLQRREERLSPGRRMACEQVRDLSFNLTLWEQYVSATERAWPSVRNGLVLRFEELLDEPHRRLRELVEFCELTPSPALLNQEAYSFDRSRQGRYNDAISGQSLAEATALPSAVKFGYGQK